LHADCGRVVIRVIIRRIRVVIGVVIRIVPARPAKPDAEAASVIAPIITPAPVVLAFMTTATIVPAFITPASGVAALMAAASGVPTFIAASRVATPLTTTSGRRACECGAANQKCHRQHNHHQYQFERSHLISPHSSG
jgi:hypothetical protein